MAKFFKCEKCGKIVGVVKKSDGVLSCCDTPMKELITFNTDGALEKHVPVVHEEDNKVFVQVGETVHPMEENHYIEWIYLLTDKGAQRKKLKPGMEPKAIFLINDDEVVLDVKAYCNIHGLYQATIE